MYSLCSFVLVDIGVATRQAMRSDPEIQGRNIPDYFRNSDGWCYIAEGCICTDTKMYPNIGIAFRGYDVVLGDFLKNGGDHGFRGHIFDEFYERDGNIRFDRTTASKFTNCDGQIDSKYIENSKEFRDSIFSTVASGSGTQIGSEVAVQVGNKETKYKVKMDIPPIYQSSTSNIDAFNKLSSGLNSKEMSMVKSTFSCYAYDLTIAEYKHPLLTSFFKLAVKDLERCFKNETRNEKDTCVKLFVDEFGTHYISRAVFGSRLIHTKLFSKSTATNSDANNKRKCAQSAKAFSGLGFSRTSDSSNTCNNLRASQKTLDKFGIGDETIVTIGSRPAKNFDDWAKQKGDPEIIRKELTPISKLFSEHFMNDMEIDFMALKPWFEKTMERYCKLYADEDIHRCNHVTDRYICPSETPSCQNKLPCGYYTGPIDKQFLPHGLGFYEVSKDGSTRKGLKRSSSNKWTHGCYVGKYHQRLINKNGSDFGNLISILFYLKL